MNLTAVLCYKRVPIILSYRQSKLHCELSKRLLFFMEEPRTLSLLPSGSFIEFPIKRRFVQFKLLLGIFRCYYYRKIFFLQQTAGILWGLF